MIDALSAHTAAGRLTLGEFSDRADVVLAASSKSDLEQVLGDLPPLIDPDRRPEERRRWAVALFGSSKRQGRWRPSDRIQAIAAMGDAHLDFREALFGGPEIVISAVAVMGDVVINVPAGMNVELSGVAVLGDKKLGLAQCRTRAGLPVLRVRAVAVMGDVLVRS